MVVHIPIVRNFGMMTDYQIEANTRRCTLTGRELRSGEKCFSALLEVDGKFIRQDYSCEAWKGPPEGAFSFWMGRIPTEQENRRPPIDGDLLYDCFQRLEGQTEPAPVNFRFVVALLLMRRRRFKFEGARKAGEDEYLCLRCTKTRSLYQVLNPGLTEEQMAAVQEEVFKVLGWQ